MKYIVKTRNWNGKIKVAKLLNLTERLGVSVYESEDFDNKYYLETTNPIKAWLIWLYFMSLRHFSGGWTYIKSPHSRTYDQLNFRYKSIYL